jgi:hypothetical protein
MLKRLSLPFLALLVALSPGCLFSRKSNKAKDNASITAETEQSLEERWLSKRSAELVAQGMKGDAARAQALQEFREKFEFTNAAKK